MSLKYTESYYIRALLNKVKIEEIMTKDVVTVNEYDRFSLVEEKLREFRIRHLPVVDFTGQLVGIITQRDLYHVQSPRRLDDGTWYYDQKSLDTNILHYVMTKDPYFLYPDDSVSKAVLIMADKRIGCIPIVKKDQSLCGIITRHDILRIAAQILREE